MTSSLKKHVIILLPYLGLPNIQITKRLKSWNPTTILSSTSRSSFRTHAASNPFFRTKTALIVLSDLRSFTKTAMMFILVKQNDDFMTGKLNILRPSLKAITYQLSLIISLPRAITSNGIILTFQRPAKLTSIVK